MGDHLNIGHETVDKTIRLSNGNTTHDIGPSIKISAPHQTIARGIETLPTRQEGSQSFITVDGAPPRPQSMAHPPPYRPPLGSYKPSQPQPPPFEDDTFLEMGNFNKMKQVDETEKPETNSPPRPPSPLHYQQPQPVYGAPPFQYDTDTIEEFDNPNIPRQGYKTINEEKNDILNKLYHLKKKGMTTNQYNVYSDISEMRTELDQLMNAINCEASVKFARKMLVACITGMEFLNKRYDPFKLKLDGWSESIMENIGDYDNVFERLYQKYTGRGNMPPEMELMFSLVGSAMMFHLTNTMFKQAIPGLGDMLKQNPQFMQNMMNMASGNANPPPPKQKPSSPDMSDDESVISMGAQPREMRAPPSFVPPMPPPPTHFMEPPKSTFQPRVTEPEFSEELDMSVMSDDMTMSGDDMSEMSSVYDEPSVKEVKIVAAKKRGRKKKT